MSHYSASDAPARQVGVSHFPGRSPRPTPQRSILIGLGSGQEAWLTPLLRSLWFRLDTEDPSASKEILSLRDVQARFPRSIDRLADLVAEAIRSPSTGP
jgi:hypothetical protein